MKKSKSARRKSAPANSRAAGLTLRQVAAAVGVDPGLLSREARRPGFPAKIVGGKPRYTAAAVIAWRRANVRQRKPTRPIADPAAPPPSSGRRPPAPPPPNPAAPPNDDAALLEVLLCGTASAIEISRAAMRLAGRRVARAAADGQLGPNDLDALKKTLQELRNAEAGYLELEKSRRGLVPRGEVAAMLTAAAGRLVRLADGLASSLSLEFSVWLADPKVAAMNADARARLVRGFIEQAAQDVRRLEANEIDAILDAQNADQ